MISHIGHRRLWLAAGLVLSLILAALAAAYWLLADLPRLSGPTASQAATLYGYAAAPSSKIYDRYGRLLYEMPPPDTGRHSPVPLDEVPLALRQALVATEDATFYENPGVDGWAILRAVWINLRGGEILSGGSTITQQLARNLLLSPEERYEQTLTRKLREAVLAWQIDRHYTKDEILELYFNEIYFGNMAYGIEAAAQAYFGKPVRDLDLAESAMLAGLPQPAATAIHAINRSLPLLNRPLAESRVLVLGGGAIGMLSTLLLKHHGARGTVVVEVNPKRRQAIEEHAEAATLDPRDRAPEESRFDYVIDAVGSKITRAVAIKAVKPGGVVMHIGLQDWASEIDMRKLTLAEIALLGAYTYTTADLRAAVRLLDEGAFGGLQWIETRALEDGPRAFADIAAGNIAAAKVVLLP